MVDRLVGEETRPIVIGEKRTRRLLVYLVFALVPLLAVAPLLGLTTGFSYLLLLACCYLGFYLLVHKHEPMRAGSRHFEILVESSFYFCGALAVLYKFIT